MTTDVIDHYAEEPADRAPPCQCRIRGAVADDAAILSSLAMRSKAHWGYDDEFMSRCRNELTYSAQQILSRPYDFQVGTINGKTIAFYALERIDVDRIELEALFVDPQHFGAGIGRLLMEHAKNRALSFGAGRMIIQGDPHAGPFYLAVGALLCGSRESGSIPGRMLPLYEVVLDQPTGGTESEI